MTLTEADPIVNFDDSVKRLALKQVLSDVPKVMPDPLHARRSMAALARRTRSFTDRAHSTG